MDFLADIFEYRYLTNAVIACILSGITCGIVGTYIVARRMVFLCLGVRYSLLARVDRSLSGRNSYLRFAIAITQRYSRSE